jgi:integrase
MARARRGHGEGSVYQLRGQWVAQVDAGRTVTGRRRYLRATRRTKAEALAQLPALRRRAAATTPESRDRTVAAYLREWVRDVAPDTVRAATARDYAGVIERHLVPHVGDHKLDKLTPMHVAKMLRDMEAEGYSPRTRQYARSILRRALSWAAQAGLVQVNAAALAQGPKVPTSAKLTDKLTAAEARKVLDTAKGDRLEALAVLVLRRGLRRGEALGLRWVDVDLDAGELTVSGSLKEEPGGRSYVDAPKTFASARTIPLGAEVTAALRAHRKRQAAEQLAAGALWRDRGYVFTRTDGRPLSLNATSQWFSALTEQAGIGRRRLHASRHTCATLMLDEGVPLEVVSAVLGHSNLSITATVYARVTADSKRRALAQIDAAIGTEDA